MEQSRLNRIANFICGIADDVLCDLYVRGKYRNVTEGLPGEIVGGEAVTLQNIIAIHGIQFHNYIHD
jgi:hypothetical protein